MADIENNEEVDVDETETDSLDNQETDTGTDKYYNKEDLDIFKKLWIDPEKATTDDLKALAKRALKAEQRIVDEKKTKKETKTTDNTIDPKAEFKRLMAEDKFYTANPEAEAYKDKIEEYQSKGLSLEDAYFLASKSDRVIEENREVYWKGIVKWSTTSSEWIRLLTESEYQRLSDEELNKYNAETKAKFWWVRFK